MAEKTGAFITAVDSTRHGPRCIASHLDSDSYGHPPIRVKGPEVETPWLVLLGTSGAGKTHLARRVFQWWQDAGQFYVTTEGRGAINSRRGQFVNWSKLIDECRGGDFSRITDICSEQLLVLDDIGAGADARGWMIDKLYHILENRLQGRKATLITANLSLEQIADGYDARIASRLIRTGRENVVDVAVPDYKLR